MKTLEGIFCGRDEFNRLYSDESETILQVQPQQCSGLQLTIVLGSSYPESAPQLSIQCPHVSRSQLDQLNERVKAEALRLQGQSMILPLVNWVIEKVQECLQVSEVTISDQHLEPCRDSGKDEASTVIINLDHIRSMKVYLKTLEQWFHMLSLHSTLILYQRWIFLLVTGRKCDIQDYLKRHRTHCVDVDSAGRPCRERLLTVLGQVDNQEAIKPTTTGENDNKQRLISVVELSRESDWLEYWHKSHFLTSIYCNFIQPHLK